MVSFLSPWCPETEVGKSNLTQCWQIESLPTRSNEEQPLQNILSISTAGRNRYLLHFNSHHSLVQWTAAIRLAMYEYSTLQEAYTGALIAGRGKSLNSINVIMERSRIQVAEWVRVRFGAGVPWRRCWCVISPPDEKEYAKLQKELKKKSPYDRSHIPVLKGDIKFYDTRVEGKKQKKLRPIATITDAYSAYALYPQAKSLIDASTLIKIEGDVEIHTEPPSSSEGFVFVMPETRPAVTGLETMLRFLFPTWDTFGLYGRPGRLAASILDSRSLMFALPKHKRYGYLELLDVTGLLVENGSPTWKEKEWRKRLKEATGTRMNAVDEGGRSHSRSASRTGSRLSFGSGKPKVGFSDDGAAQQRNRNVSDPSISGSMRQSPAPGNMPPFGGAVQDRGLIAAESPSSDDDRGTNLAPTLGPLEGMRAMHTPEPVSQPPALSHPAQGRPTSKAYHSPELRRANSRLSTSTLAQLAGAGGIAIPTNPNSGTSSRENVNGGISGPSVFPHANSVGTYANDNRSREALNPSQQNRLPGGSPAGSMTNQRPRSPYGPPGPHSAPGPYMAGPNSRPHTSEGRRSPMPPGPNNRFPPEGGRGGGPGPGPGPQGRGQPNPRPLPNGPPQHDQFNNNRPPYHEPRGLPSRPGPGPSGPLPMHPNRKPIPGRGEELDKHTSIITPNSIIEHYAANQGPYGGQYDSSLYGAEPLPPRPPPHQVGGGGQGNAYNNFDNSLRSEERPRAGVMKTVGGGEPPRAGPGFDIPSIDFGPTVNYGAGAGPPRQLPVPGDGHMQRPGGPNNGHGRQGSSDERSKMAWQPGLSTSPNSQGLTPEQYVQQRAEAASAPYGHGRQLSANTLGGRSTSPGMNSGRSISPQPGYPMGRGGGPSGGAQAGGAQRHHGQAY